MIINPGFFMEQCDNDRDMMVNMIDVFFTTAPDYVRNIKEAFSKNKYEELKVAAHAYLSSLKIVGAQQLVDVVKQIELDISNQEYKDLSPLTKKTSDMTEVVLEELKELKKR